MHPTRLRCCCSACSRFCALYFTCAAAAAHHQRGPLRHLRAALGAAADAAAPILHRRAHFGDASRHDPAGFMDAMPRGWQPCHFLWPGSLRSRSRCSVLHVYAAPAPEVRAPSFHAWRRAFPSHVLVLVPRFRAPDEHTTDRNQNTTPDTTQHPGAAALCCPGGGPNCGQLTC